MTGLWRPTISGYALAGGTMPLANITSDFILALAALVTAIAGLFKIFRDSKSNFHKIKDLQDDLKRFRLDYARLDNLYRDTKAAYEQLIELLGERDMEYSQLQKSFEMLQTMYTGLSSKYDLLNANYETLRAQYDGLKMQYEEVCRENEEIKRQIAVVKKQTGELKN